MIYIRVYEAISTHTTATVVGFFSFKIVDNVPQIRLVVVELKNNLNKYKMKLDEIIKNYTHYLTDENQNKWKVIETSDIEEICKEYHEQQLILSGVSKRLFLVGYVYDGEHCSKEVEAPNELAAKYTAISGLKGKIEIVSCLELNVC